MPPFATLIREAVFEAVVLWTDQQQQSPRTTLGIADDFHPRRWPAVTTPGVRLADQTKLLGALVTTARVRAERRR